MKTRDVPVIDMEILEDTQTRSAIDRACREWGFFQVVNHGIDNSIIDQVQRHAQRFFSQPKSLKREILRTRDNPWGYYDQELTKNTLDWKEIFDYGPAQNLETEGDTILLPRWPRGMPGFRRAVLDYYRAAESLSFRLLSAISSNLGMPPDYLSADFTGQHSSFVRLNHYPVCPVPAHPDGENEPTRGYLGLNRHTDAGALTILLQDGQPGLEVFKDGTWHLVKPLEGALTINVGDIVQVWSNDRYKAALHRVIANPRTERFSVPFFFSPRYSTNYRPLPSTVDVLNPPHYHAINWGQFRALRAAGDYEDRGEEIQINHYRIAQGDNDHGLYRNHAG